MFKKGDIVRTLPRNKYDEEYWVEVHEVNGRTDFSGTTIKVIKTNDPSSVQVGKFHQSFNTPWFELDTSHSIEVHMDRLLQSLNVLEGSLKKEEHE